MKTRRSSAFFAAAAAILIAPQLQAQSRLLDRIKERAEELTDTAEAAGQDVDTVINADEIAADRVENAGRQAELEAERDVLTAVSAAACFIPTRRATLIGPMAALRCQ